jgi:hypothetical protein
MLLLQFARLPGLSGLQPAAKRDHHPSQWESCREDRHQQYHAPAQIAKQHGLVGHRRIHVAAKRLLPPFQRLDLSVGLLLEVAHVVSAAHEGDALAVMRVAAILVAIDRLRFVSGAAFAGPGDDLRLLNPAGYLLPATCRPPAADGWKIQKPGHRQPARDERQTKQHRAASAELFHRTHDFRGRPDVLQHARSFAQTG